MLYIKEDEEKNDQADQSSQEELVTFAGNEALGEVVSGRKLLCQIGVTPITDLEKQLQFACGFDKLGFLCGFKFTSSYSGSVGKIFYVVFVPKLKSSIMRQQKKGRSSWYVWEWNNSTDVNVLSKSAALKKFGFDIDQFFKSDLFKSAIPKFLKAVRKALDVDIPLKIQAFQNDHSACREFNRYIKAIEDSLKTLKDSQHSTVASLSFNLGSSDDGETKIYRANKSYELDHFQKRAKEEVQKSKNEFLAWLAARNQRIAADQKNGAK